MLEHSLKACRHPEGCRQLMGIVMQPSCRALFSQQTELTHEMRREVRTIFLGLERLSLPENALQAENSLNGKGIAAQSSSSFILSGFCWKPSIHSFIMDILNVRSVLGNIAKRLPTYPPPPTSLSTCPPEAFNQEVEISKQD